MKKNKNSLPVNKQEDEDGYILDPGNAIISEKSNRKGMNFHTPANTQNGDTKLQSRNSIYSSPVKLSRIR